VRPASRREDEASLIVCALANHRALPIAAIDGGPANWSLDAPTGADIKRIGFMAGKIEVPDDFDEMGRKNIERLFTSGEV
jgi:hypothetical protein